MNRAQTLQAAAIAIKKQAKESNWGRTWRSESRRCEKLYKRFSVFVLMLDWNAIVHLSNVLLFINRENRFRRVHEIETDASHSDTMMDLRKFVLTFFCRADASLNASRNMMGSRRIGTNIVAQFTVHKRLFFLRLIKKSVSGVRNGPSSLKSHSSDEGIVENFTTAVTELGREKFYIWFRNRLNFPFFLFLSFLLVSVFEPLSMSSKIKLKTWKFSLAERRRRKNYFSVASRRPISQETVIRVWWWAELNNCGSLNCFSHCRQFSSSGKR